MTMNILSNIDMTQYLHIVSYSNTYNALTVGALTVTLKDFQIHPNFLQARISVHVH